MSGRRAGVAIAVGGVALAAHVVALPILAERSRRPSLEVRLDPPAATDATIDPRDGAVIDPRLANRVEPPPSGPLGPGLHNLRWQARYRGGFASRVGAAHLAGPFQSPADPPCSVRVRLGQALLDDGSGGPHTIAGVIRPLLEAELRGVSAWPLGDYEAVEHLSLRWVDSRVGDPTGAAGPRTFLGVDIEAPPAGFLALSLELRFSRGRVPLLVGLIPSVRDGGIAVRSFARAEIDVESRVVSLVLAILSGDRRASELAESEIAGALVDVLEPPPPLDLGGGRTLRLRYCDADGDRDNSDITIAGDRYAEIALAVELEHRRGDVMPPRFAPITAPVDPATPGPPVAVDIDASGLSALVHQLWAAGVLDDALAAADLAGSFNRDPDVEAMLTLRVGALALAGPPVVAPAPGGFSLAAELALVIRDGGAGDTTATPARLFAAAEIDVTGARPVSRAALADLSLTCRPGPERLRACYSLLVDELVGRSELVTEWLEGWLEASFDELFSGRRLAVTGAPKTAVLERASATAPAPGLLRIALGVRLESP